VIASYTINISTLIFHVFFSDLGKSANQTNNLPERHLKANKIQYNKYLHKCIKHMVYLENNLRDTKRYKDVAEN
jgi:hypothetical protein